MTDALFSGNALFFTIPALAGTLVFLAKLGLMALVGVGDFDLDTDVDVDVDLGDAAEGGDSTAAFSLLSIQAIAAFLMGFGWGGLGAAVGLDWSLAPSLALGGACGVAMVWLLGIVFKAVYDLQSSGNVKISDAVGREATVYATIPAGGDGRGQVRVVINERARIFSAMTDGDAVPTNKTVRVTRVDADRTLVVAAV